MPIPLDDIHHRVLTTISPDSCQWLLKKDEFSRWRTTAKTAGRYPLLWVTGGAGCGKTHLAAKAIEYLESMQHTSFFYADAQDSHRRGTLDILRNWCWQLLRQDQSHLADVVHIKETQQLASEKVLEDKVLRGILLQEHEGAVFVIDAFDECEGQEQAKLLSLLSRVSRQARILLFSRPLPEGFRTVKKQIPQESLTFFEISENDTRDDINHYIKDEVAELELDDVAIATEIVSTLHKKAKGMFLWVSLTLQELKKPRFDESELFETLKYLPEDLDTLYHGILQKIHPRDRSTSRNLLQLLLFAQRPL